MKKILWLLGSGFVYFGACQQVFSLVAPVSIAPNVATTNIGVNPTLNRSQFDTKLAAIIDHTILKPNATREDLIRACDEAKKYGFAAVCVYPSNISLAKAAGAAFVKT